MIQRILRWFRREPAPPPPTPVLTAVLVCHRCIRRTAVLSTPAVPGLWYVGALENAPCGHCRWPCEIEIAIRAGA